MIQTPSIPARRIVVLMPNWLGDAVMATPFLRALRGLYPQAHIAAAHLPLIAPVLAGLPFVNETHEYTKSHPRPLLHWLRANAFDLAILLPNSFRSAWMVFRARIPQRVGYARECRSVLLTNRVPVVHRDLASWHLWYARAYVRSLIRKLQLTGYNDVGVHNLRQSHSDPSCYLVTLDSEDGRTRDEKIRVSSIRSYTSRLRGYQPIPTIDYYLKLAAYLGASPDLLTDRRMHLAITPAEEVEAADALHQLGLASDPAPPFSALGSQPFVTLVPGGTFGSSKCWPPERFAQLALRLIDPSGPFSVRVLIASSPAERPIVDAIVQHARQRSAFDIQHSLIPLAHLNSGRGVSLGALKSLVQCSRLMITNDTGPRHFAAALNTPVVTLFGPTDPVWAETFYDRERILRVPVPCGPCQLKKCPLDQRCMTALTMDMVLAAAQELWT